MQAKVAALTPREREVLKHVVAGRLNKQIAYGPKDHQFTEVQS
jgi:FixJ family two-component response regulator